MVRIIKLFKSCAVMLCCVWIHLQPAYAAEQAMDEFNVLVTAYAENGDICGPNNCGDNLNREQLADKAAEQFLLTLYRFEKAGTSLGHKYEKQNNAFILKKPDQLKPVCLKGPYDAVISINVDGGEDSIGQRGKRDLVIRWSDCNTLESWKESMSVDYANRGWDFRQLFYKYLDVVFPYFAEL